MLGSIDIITWVYCEGQIPSGGHVLNPANNTYWAWHTKAISLAICANRKSSAHLATPPFPNPGVFVRRPKDMLGTWVLSSNLQQPLVKVEHVPYLPPP